MLLVEKKSLKVGKFVNTDHVNTVIKNYKQERWVNNSKHIGKEDSLSAWLSIEEMEEFIAKAKDQGGDGIRVYFAAYSEDYAEQPLYAGRQTIVLVGTKHKKDESGLAANKDIYISTDKGTGILAYNSVLICPPFCKPKGIDDGNDVGITLVDKGEDGLVVV
ncbi:MAG: hypothetical protein JWM28_2697 [Chitinophagaceae bacterium]|nr:hypothetical protein [Chitinophagaceae bacterium]